MTEGARRRRQELGGLKAHASTSASTLRGRWLLLARVAWVTVAIAALAVVVASTPSSFEHYRGVCADVSGICSGRTVVQPSMLVAVYIGGVAGLQYALRALSGRESEVAIVASTLAIAALFQPLRRHLQSFIDRRFYRRKYDARRTLDRFSEMLRDEPDLGGLEEDLAGVVSDTVQPSHVSVWLRPSVPANPHKGTLG